MCGWVCACVTDVMSLCVRAKSHGVSTNLFLVIVIARGIIKCKDTHVPIFMLRHIDRRTGYWRVLEKLIGYSEVLIESRLLNSLILREFAKFLG